jgi:periplasmic divalent cation tolerance protein
MSATAVVGLVTCASRAEARRIARALLAAKAAACVNIVGPIESHYWWQGKIELGREFLLLLKTTRRHTARVERLVREQHSYQVPEIIFVPVAAGERHYLRWLRESVK